MRLQKVPESSTRPLMTLGDDGVWQCDVCADCKLGESQSEKGVGDTMDQILKLCAKLICWNPMFYQKVVSACDGMGQGECMRIASGQDPLTST